MKTEDQFDKDSNTSGGMRQNQPSGKRSNWLPIVLATVIVFVIGSFGVAYYTNQRHFKDQISQIDSEKKELSFRLQGRDSVINDYLGSFNEIEENINAIKQKENIVNRETNDKEYQGDKKKQIVDDIKIINSLLEKNKMQVAALKVRLANSGLKLSEFENKINELNMMIAQSDSSVAVLKQQLLHKDFEIAQLNQKVDTMGQQIHHQTGMIALQDTEMHKAFLISGTYKELKAKGLIAKSGGFLGVGRNTKVNNGLAEDLFKPLDIREMKEIPVDAKKAEFITNHPLGSYQIVKKNDKVEYIKITDPEKFWKYTRYAVLETR
jgi:hypothetical protein